MYASLLNQPNNLFGQFERLRRELERFWPTPLSTTGGPSTPRTRAASANRR